jgi:hypothetical protein
MAVCQPPRSSIRAYWRREPRFSWMALTAGVKATSLDGLHMGSSGDGTVI